MLTNDKDIRLNFIPIEFTSRKFQGTVLDYQDKDHLNDLRNKYHNKYVFIRQGNVIYGFPLIEPAPNIGKIKEFDIDQDFTLAKSLLHQALIRFFESKGHEFASFYPTVEIVLTKEDMLADLTGESKPDFPVFLLPQYEIESRLIVPHSKKMKFGFLLNFSAKLGFNGSLSNLISSGLDVSGLYVTKDYEIIKGQKSIPNPKFRRMLVGKVKEIRGNTVALTDFRDSDSIRVDECYLEPRLENIDYCLSRLYPTRFDELTEKRKAAIFRIVGAEYQVDRLGKIIQWLKKNTAIKCSVDLSFTIADRQYSPGIGRDVGQFRFLSSPSCVLRPDGLLTVKWPVDAHLEDKGPFDADSFPHKSPRIAVIFPPRSYGEVDIFMRQFKDGVNDQRRSPDRFIPYAQGFARKYRLTRCDVDFYPLDDDSEHAESYRKKCLEVLSKDIAYNLAIVVIREQFHELRGEENPYLVSKSAFMSQGLPVQEIEIETIHDERGRPYVLNNLALACYAKLGGIPWVLSSVRGLTHELIFGIGSARKSDGRLSPSSERIIGITTVFSGDGNYLLTNFSKEVPFERYQESLLEALKDTLEQIKKRYAWQPGDKVRLIFHQTFKKYQDAEVAAVKDFVSEISDFDVEFAFVHISRSHPWRIFDFRSAGVNHWVEREKKTKGRFVPWRGCYVPLGPYASILLLTGPHQLKTHLQGCPEPILISLHRDSTFRSLDYVAEQIYKLTFMSWRSFFPSGMPVTISYSDEIAKLLGQLRDIPKWNPDMLITKLRESRWFL